MELTTAFPGGNAIIKQDEKNKYLIEPDQRIGTMLWFYWCFKLLNPQDQTYSFVLSPKCTTNKGYAISFDQGLTWQWAEPSTFKENTITFQAPANTSEVILSMGMTYTLKNWDYFLSHHNLIKEANLETLCTTRNGRKTPLLRIKKDQVTKYKIIVTARHHCCEMMASYALEGMIKYIFQNINKNEFRETEIVFIPMVDLDGVEEGDQGKGRAPHDHNRDYGETCIYPETPAIKAEVNKNKNLRVMTLDVHCPHLKGVWNEQVYLVGSPYDRIVAEEKKFLEIVEAENDSELPFGKKNVLPYGVEWNTTAPGASNGTWCSQQSHVVLASSIEIPYGISEGHDVTQDSARNLGEVLIKAMIQYIKT